MVARSTQIFADDVPPGYEVPPSGYRIAGAHIVRAQLDEETYQAIKHASLHSKSRQSMSQLISEALARKFVPHYAYAHDKHYAFGRLKWEYTSPEFQKRIIAQCNDDEALARSEYIRACRAQPIFAD
jgi:hypothetical protein